MLHQPALLQQGHMKDSPFLDDTSLSPRQLQRFSSLARESSTATLPNSIPSQAFPSVIMLAALKPCRVGAAPM